LTLVSEINSLRLKKIKKFAYKGSFEKKILKIALKNIIFEVLEVDRRSSKYFYDGFVFPG
jgi:hypothetical protein